MAKVRLIAAIDDKRGLAKDSNVPWDIPTDRKYFRDHVVEGPVLVGFKTFQLNKYKPYGHGKNYVVSYDKKQYDGVTIVNDLKEFFNSLTEDIWVAGGGQIFTQSLAYATELYLTQVKGDYGCNVFFPEFENSFELSEEQTPQTENGITYTYQIWRRKT